MEIINDPRRVKARKKHKCDWCGYAIPAGMVYSTATYKHDYIYTWKSHIKCIELVDKLNMQSDEGVTEECFYECVTEEFRQIWIELDNNLYESKDFVIPDLEEQIDFVHEKRCSGIE